MRGPLTFDDQVQAEIYRPSMDPLSWVSEYISVNFGRLGRPDVEVWTFRYTCRLGVSDQAEDGIGPKAEHGEMTVDSDAVMLVTRR